MAATSRWESVWRLVRVAPWNHRSSSFRAPPRLAPARLRKHSRFRFAPSSGFLNLATACSASEFAGLLHPATTYRVRSVQGFLPIRSLGWLLASPCPPAVSALRLTARRCTPEGTQLCAAAISGPTDFEALLREPMRSSRPGFNRPLRRSPLRFLSPPRYSLPRRESFAEPSRSPAVSTKPSTVSTALRRAPLQPMGTQKTCADSPLDRPAIPRQLPESLRTMAETNALGARFTAPGRRTIRSRPCRHSASSRPPPVACAHGLERDSLLLWVTLSVLSTRRLVLPLPESLPA